MSHANIIIKRRVFSVPAWEAFIKRASKITVVIHPAKLTLIKNVLNPRALWRVIISVSPLFFHTLSDRDVDFINAPREWDSFAQDVSCIIGEDSRRIWAGDGSSKQELGCWSRLGHDKGFKSIFPPSQKLLLRSRATSVSALFFMNVCSPSAPAMLPFQRPEQTNTYVKYPLNLGLVISWIQKSKAKYPTIQSLQCQLQSQQIDVALLQDFSVWVCKAALLQFHYAAGKIHPENKSLLVWNGFPVYCDNFLSDSCLAGCPKLTFWIQCEKLYLLWM